MENAVSLGDDGIVSIICQGDQDYETVSTLQRNVEKITKQLHDQQKPIRIYADVTKLGKTNSESRKLGLTLIMKTSDIDRVALVGQDISIKYLINFMITAAGKEQVVKYFPSSDIARKWLQEMNQ